MEIAVTPEWSCLELKHCCNQYRLSWGWRARTFRSPFVEIMETIVIFPRHAGNYQIWPGLCRLWWCLRETNTKRSVLSRALFEAAQALRVTEVTGLQLTKSTWKVVLDVLCSLPGTRRRNWLSAKILCRLYCSKWSYRQLTLVFPQCLKNTSKALIWSFRYLRSYSCFHFCFCIFNVCSNNMMDFGVDGLKPDRRAGLNRLCSQGGCSELILETHFEFVTFIFGKRTKWYTSFKPSDKPLRPLWLNHSAICCWTTHFQIKGCKTEFGSPVKCSTCTGA